MHKVRTVLFRYAPVILAGAFLFFLGNAPKIDKPDAAHPDQGEPGAAVSPDHPVGWENGSLHDLQAPFTGGYTIPYRLGMTEWPINILMAENFEGALPITEADSEMLKPFDPPISKYFVMSDTDGSVIAETHTDDVARRDVVIDDLDLGVRLDAGTTPIQSEDVNTKVEVIDLVSDSEVISSDTAPLGPGPFPPCGPSGTLFCDANNNGKQDSGEPGISNVTVQLLQNGITPIGPINKTDAHGNYALPAGPTGATYNVVTDFGNTNLDLSMWQIPNGGVSEDVLVVHPDDFCFVANFAILPEFTVSGYVWEDVTGTGDPAGANLANVGMNDVRVTLTGEGRNETVITFTEPGTLNKGYYVITNVVPGDYQLAVEKLEDFPSTTGVSRPFRIEGCDPSSVSPFPGFGIQSLPTAIELVLLEASAAAGGVQIIWETASEVDNIGFNILRSATISGPKHRVNRLLFLGQGTGTGRVYQLFEAGVPDGTWYYWLEDVDVNFISTLHGPAEVVVGKVGSVELVKSGPHRISHQVLEQSGLANYDRLQVFIDDMEIPIHVVEGSHILFYVPQGAKQVEFGESDKPLRINGVEAPVTR